MSNQQTAKKKYIIGTRGSLLALTQCKQVQQHLEDVTGASFELKIIKTQGDMDTSKPLWQMEGKDFFTKELDHALLNREIDLVVHSYKDLGSDRPDGIKLAAITKRQFPHDILLMRKDVVNKIKEVKKLNIGTGSPRRIFNIEKSLSHFIPYNPEVKTSPLRGNVNTRIKKCIDGQYDGIVLAFAGLERLALNEQSFAEISPLLDQLEFMILPTSTFPAAASQGALAIESHESNDELNALLEKVHHAPTAKAVGVEREIFQSFGGGCHLAVGITTTSHQNILRTSVQGISDGVVVDRYELSSTNSTQTTPEDKVFIGLPLPKDNPSVGDELTEKYPLENKLDLKSEVIYLTSLNGRKNINLAEASFLATAGTKSWKDIAKEGVWVHACSDGLGEDELIALKSSKLLNKINPKLSGDWKVCSHPNGETELGEIIPSYDAREITPPADFEEKLKNCEVFFWTSYRQYETYLKHYPWLSEKTHCCGLGKTWQKMETNKVDVTPFSGMKEFKRWLK